jgi:predicted nucleic acid-binding protein
MSERQRDTEAVSEVFVDTSGIFAALDADDANHASAAALFDDLLEDGTTLVVTSYVLAEAAALVQRRLGIDAARRLLRDHASVFDIAWVDEDLHSRGVDAWLAAGRRSLSLVDCVSFALMRELRLDTVFALDRHFAEQGFRVVPEA